MQSLDYLINYDVFRHAFITGLAIAVVCSLLSVLVVLKRMAFIGQGISHAGFGGIGLAILLGVIATRAQDVLVLGFCIGAGVMIGVLSRRRQLEADTAIGIMLAGTMALGVLLADVATVLHEHAWYRAWFGVPEARPSFETLLFGSLTSVSATDMWTAIGLSVAVILVMALLFKEMLYFAFDETAAHVSGVATGMIYYLLLVLLSVAIVMSIRLVGIVLVSALLVIPGATAVLLSQRLGSVILASLAVGLAGTAGGLVLSLEAGYLSSGACIVLVLCGIFAAVFAGRSALNRRGRIA
ncbi:MAG: metal ABC transporter permease [Phycisphaeraceae bacterium]